MFALFTESQIDIQVLQNQMNNPAISVDAIRSDINKLTILHLGPLAFLRGVVACGSQDLLVSELSSFYLENDLAGSGNDQKSTELFVFQLWLYIHVLCEGDITLHYHAFQILSLWFSRVVKLTSLLKSSNVGRKCAYMVRRAWELVMLNWDSPVEDVPEIVVEIFGYVMTMWEFAKSEIPDFAHEVLGLIQETPWFVKGKYRVFGVLLSFVDTEKV